MKDHNSWSRADCKHWKRFAEMDGIYGDRLTTNGREWARY